MKTDLKKSGRISTIKLFRPSTKDELQDAIDDWVNDSQVNTFNNVNISNWDTSLITDMSEIFKLQSSFNEDISGWDVSNVNNFNEMFKGATSFNKNLDKISGLFANIRDTFTSYIYPSSPSID